ncbi:TPA: winged helix-turn-helix domain-containing protein [Klebsiella oxytoca]|nr:winged helix-turn-helix domain-containing protein [Klebsiella oxytoca]
MDYLIGDRVYFSTASGSLRDTLTGEDVHLPPSAIFILTMLIQHHGDAVSRELFFDTAWNEYGFQLSGNTLTQHVSLLRRHLRYAELPEDTILTLPRRGFCLNDAVPIQAISVQASPHPFQQKSPLRWKRGILFLAGILVLTEIIWVVNAERGRHNWTPSFLGRLGNCDVYTTHNLNQSYASQAMRIATGLAGRYLPCGKDEIYIFDTDGGLIFQHDGRAFLSRCDQLPGGHLSGCQEVLIYSMPTRSEGGS